MRGPISAAASIQEIDAANLKLAVGEHTLHMEARHLNSKRLKEEDADERGTVCTRARQRGRSARKLEIPGPREDDTSLNDVIRHEGEKRPCSRSAEKGDIVGGGQVEKAKRQGRPTPREGRTSVGKGQPSGRLRRMTRLRVGAVQRCVRDRAAVAERAHARSGLATGWRILRRQHEQP